MPSSPTSEPSTVVISSTLFRPSRLRSPPFASRVCTRKHSTGKQEIKASASRKPSTRVSVPASSPLPSPSSSVSTQTSALMLRPVPQMGPTALDASSLTSTSPSSSACTLVVKHSSLLRRQSRLEPQRASSCPSMKMSTNSSKPPKSSDCMVTVRITASSTGKSSKTTVTESPASVLLTGRQVCAEANAHANAAHVT
eukprot:scaffold8151_cov239-Pinguiococcus_pyrenoidosus.AAC.2